MSRMYLHAVSLLSCVSLLSSASSAQSAQSDTSAGRSEAAQVAAVPSLPLSEPRSPVSSEASDESTGPLYVIRPNDALEIYVYGEPELSRRVVVRPDGRISLPLVQDLLAAGMNPAQLKQSVEASLTRYLDNPNVTVIVDAIQSYEVYVTGLVARPGLIANETPINVLQALALAGGFQQFADKRDIVIIRTTKTQSVRFPFNYDRVVKGENIEQNLLLESGDVIVVP